MNDMNQQPSDISTGSTLVNHGKAAFEFKDGNKPSYFVTTETKAGKQTVWGIDLERAIKESAAVIGDIIHLSNKGQQPVKVTKEILDGNGKAIGNETIDAKKNAWQISVVSKADAFSKSLVNTNSTSQEAVNPLLNSNATFKDSKPFTTANEPIKEPHYVWAVNKTTGELNLIGKDKDGKPLLIKEEEVKKHLEQGGSLVQQDKAAKPNASLSSNKEEDILSFINGTDKKLPFEANREKNNKVEGGLEVLEHKGFLGNFIVNFQKNYSAAKQYEIIASPISMKLEDAYKAIKSEVLAIKDNAIQGLENLKHKYGIVGLDKEAERAFVFKPEKEQQEILRNYFQFGNSDKAFTISNNEKLQMPIEKDGQKLFLQYLANPIVLSPIEIKANVDTTIMQKKFDPNKINWEEAKRFGITKELLLKEGNLEKLLNGEKTSLLQGLKGDVGGLKVSLDGKLRLVAGPDGNPQFVFHGVKANLTVPKEFLGYIFTDEDRKNLIQNGELGKVVQLRDKITNEKYSALIGVDKETKEVIALRTEKVQIPNTIKGVELSPEQKRSLKEGRPTLITGLKDGSGNEFSAFAQVSVAKKGIEFKPAPDIKVKVDSLNVQVKDVTGIKKEGESKKTNSVKVTSNKKEEKKVSTSKKQQSKPKL